VPGLLRRIADVPAFTVIGSTVRTTNARETSGSNGKIGPLWNQFMHGGEQGISGVIEREKTYAVYTNYEGDETAAYDLTLGKSVHSEQPAPAGMKSIHIPAARYLVFSATGSSPDAIKAAWGNVYDYFAHHTGRRRAFTIDFEQYSSSGTRLFIAIRWVSHRAFARARADRDTSPGQVRARYGPGVYGPPEVCENERSPIRTPQFDYPIRSAIE
jgi:predicted transcriptional regulator YdeE